MSAVSENPKYIIEINSEPAQIKVNIGCGGDWKLSGWFGLDRRSTPTTCRESDNLNFIDLDVKKGLPFSTNSVDVIFSSHTLEHFTYEEGIALLFEIYRVLKAGAPLCLVVPDMDLYIASYVARNLDFLANPRTIGGTPRRNLTDNFLMNFYSDPKFNNTCHKYAYNFENLSSALLDVGFAAVQNVKFHDFSYWPELRKPEFISSMLDLEAISLSVQCRKLEFDADYRESLLFKESQHFAGFSEKEGELRQQLNAALLLNADLQGRLTQATAELDLRNEVIDKQLSSPDSLIGREAHELVHNNSSGAMQLRRQLEGLLSEKLQADRALRSVRARWAASEGLNGLIHYLREGASKGLTPSPEFDGNWYLAEYPDVARSGMNPLLHYVQRGALEGRKPKPGSSSGPTGANNSDRLNLAPLTEPAELGVHFLIGDRETQKALEKSRTDRAHASAISGTRYSPLISIVLFTYNTPSKYLREVVGSVHDQLYSAWELCIVDDCSTETECVDELEHIRRSDQRIKLYVAPKHGGADVLEQGLAMAAGDYVAFLDQHGVLAPNALYEAVQMLRNHRSIDVIYTDHASLDQEGVLSSPCLKPDWSPEFFFSTNFVMQLVLCKRSYAEKLGAFAGSISNVQEIAWIWELAESGAQIRHLPKVLYFRRVQNGSVASDSLAYSSIVSATLKAHNEHLQRMGSDISVACPDHFRDLRLSACKLQFAPGSTDHIAIVVPYFDQSVDLSGLIQSFRKTRCRRLPTVYLIGDTPPPDLTADSGFVWHSARKQSEFDQVVDRLECESLVLLSPGALLISPSWLTELVGYLSLSPQIGAVGGKILDDRLNVRAGGVVLLREPQPISLGEVDESDGPWLRNRLASNVEAVSAKLMATSTRAYAQAGGLPIFRYGDEAGTAFSLRLRTAGYRLVYNPWSKIVDTAPQNVPADLPEMLDSDFGQSRFYDRYYHPFFSLEVPYAL